jgi:predicted enzyme related to lactoylglutathione lyase
MSKSKKTMPASLCWFEVPADDLNRARKFYGSLFGWKFNPLPASSIPDYQHIETGGPDASPDGGLMPRMHAGHTITNYIMVPSVNRYVAKIKKLGGEICRPKTAVTGLGYFAICQDTEKNTFAIWEVNDKAK